ncbi:hypothetical protein L596_030573 [Steinernema carpocapsae]|nr:hypothetical protein L596_030573 [Steinernema carpocapsae]
MLGREAINTSTSTSSAAALGAPPQQHPLFGSPLPPLQQPQQQQPGPPPHQRRLHNGAGADGVGCYGANASNQLSQFRSDIMSHPQQQQQYNYYNPAPPRNSGEEMPPPQATAHLYGTQPLNYFAQASPDFHGYNQSYYQDVKPPQMPPMQMDQSQMMWNKGFSQPPQPQMPHMRPSTSSSHQSASANDPCNQISHVLQCYQQGGEDSEYVKKAIESLVKKLKDKASELDSLITAVISAGKQPTSCVTIQRSLDGRLQVAGRKGVPHVVYARIWRWPNVSKNELQKLPICEISNDNQDLICINPYHYERVVSSAIGNIDMATLRIDLPSSSGGHQPVGSPGPSNMSQMNPRGPMSSQSGGPMSRSHPMDIKEPLLMYSPHQQPSCVLSHTPGGDVSNVVVGSATSNSEQWMTVGASAASGGVSTVGASSAGAAVSGTADTTTPTSADANNSPAMRMTSQQQQISHPQSQQSQQPFANSSDRARYNHSCRYDVETTQVPTMTLPEHWCSICYYELDTQIGETFKVRKEQSELIVDGGMDPAGGKNGRFCLGALPNVHRCEASEKAR